MAKIRAGKVKPKAYFGDDAEANELYHAYKAAKEVGMEAQKGHAMEVSRSRWC